jgi:hypothetical protein
MLWGLYVPEMTSQDPWAQNVLRQHGGAPSRIVSQLGNHMTMTRHNTVSFYVQFILIDVLTE